ncbi:uncharacterized protein LOC115771842 [Drosophila novamexicana]|uniref:uncharacterized protein LOC115771842 n=1 Tax=Drosophila novamexicana TaxID=47314 RepID=UPI0011E58DC8|nr:uncharacterized protein LOC115771842 [Drosophila novamexicana]
MRAILGIMLGCLFVCLVLGQLVMPVIGAVYANCSEPSTQLTSCGQISANGCCAKGCIRNAVGRCVVEQCTGSWNGWLRRPVTMSCYFHWFLLIFAAVVIALMTVIVILNLIFEVRVCLRKRRLARYVRFSPRSSPSSSVV